MDAPFPIDYGDPELVAVYDELPLWSAPFGLKLLSMVRYRRGLSALDLGCGTGFPMLELAQRLGDSCHVSGLDPWEAAVERLHTKIRVRSIQNATPILGRAEEMPFENGTFDLIVSNNGLNNVDDPAAALAECARVSRPDAQLVVTFNLPDTMKEFYDIYEATLVELRLKRHIERLRDHIAERRKPADVVTQMVERAGFRLEREESDSFTMDFTDGSALFRHFFIQIAFLESWRAVVPEGERTGLMERLEAKLNDVAHGAGMLRLTVPFLALSATRRL
jgi:arsenite methyltransferase